MKIKTFKTTGKFSNAFYLILITLLIFSIGPTANTYADKAKELDSKADEALKRFDTHVKDAKEVIRRAKAGFRFGHGSGWVDLPRYRGQIPAEHQYQRRSAVCRVHVPDLDRLGNCGVCAQRHLAKHLSLSIRTSRGDLPRRERKTEG